MADVRLRLTPKQADLLAGILGFVEAGEVSGGPLDDDSPQQRAANVRMLDTVATNLALARAHAAYPTRTL